MHKSLSILLLLFVTGCATAGATTEEDCIDCIEAQGTVRYSQVEGGFWYLEADDGAKYDPYGIPEEFAIDGLRVKFIVQPQPDRMGFHMMGTIVKLIEIERLSGGKPTE